MSVQAKRGRPAQFRNAAEKQKAYRERQKLATALRNSSGSILEKPQPVNSDLMALWETKCLHTAKHDKLRFMVMYGPEWETFGGYEEWNRQIRANLELTWKADSAWYDEWKRQDYPTGPWSDRK